MWQISRGGKRNGASWTGAHTAAGGFVPAAATKSRRAPMPSCASASASNGNPIVQGNNRAWKGQLDAAHSAHVTSKATAMQVANSRWLLGAKTVPASREA